MAETAMQVMVNGKVQGVGYRDFVREAAAARHVRGWVRNAGDGSVEAALAGEALDLEAVVADMRAGPRAAQVAEVETQPGDLEAVRGCKDVEIRD
ncbi:Acylphosphatase [Roseivivax jejudonensis]|uniref:acylphosphatase n=1 Tax=Roseivivax jejudonensis TaxID=1529041 RepID=A0A1X6ZE94_9RHOB|nr:acylphosphatase [Roseivivax jejudonensis]SLN48753.1 Acylphosphatase [Roseivivax jejudonensis]